MVRGAVLGVGAALLAGALLALAIGSAPAPAAAADAAAGATGKRYSEKGADTCLNCHDEESTSASYAVNAIFKSRHAHRGNPRAPFGAGGLQCEACHGPGGNHAAKGSDKKATIINFKANAIVGVQERNGICLGCHQDQTRNAWHGAAHDRSQLACTDCHKMHVDGGDKVLARSTQPAVCFGCHQQQRADFQKPSSHPVRHGKMGCSDCHNPHGSTATAALIRPTLNQTCFTCHAEKRGPLLWEHAPVAEDCSLCHAAHGTVRQALLNKPAPLLCQQCHSPAGHPSVPRTATGLPGGAGGGAVFQVAGSCTNCHTQVHGSNHPAGRKLMR